MNMYDIVGANNNVFLSKAEVKNNKEVENTTLDYGWLCNLSNEHICLLSGKL